MSRKTYTSSKLFLIPRGFALFCGIKFKHMQPVTSILRKAAALAIICLSIFSIQARAGADYFKVYLNNKLILEQYVGKTIDLKQLQLDRSNINDQLVFHYSHCGQIGTGRKVAVIDAKGNIIKEWKFEDVSGKHAGMIIPVKELLQLKQDDLQFVYTAKELPKGQLMAAVKLTDKTTGYHPALQPQASHWLLAILFSRWSSTSGC